MIQVANKHQGETIKLNNLGYNPRGLCDDGFMSENPCESRLFETFSRLWDQPRQTTQGALLDPARLERDTPLWVARIRELNPVMLQ